MNSLIDSLIVTLSFWSGLLLIIYKKLFYFIKFNSKIFLISFSIFLLLHETLFGIYTSLYSGYPNVFSIGIGYDYFISKSAFDFITAISFSPALWMFIKGVLVEVIPINLFYGVILSILFAFSVDSIIKLKRKKAGILPIGILGLSSASSCCLSIPTLISILVFSSNLLLLKSIMNLLTSFLGYVTSFYLLPILTIVALYLFSKSLYISRRKCDII
jgi:hypothetical protein